MFHFLLKARDNPADTVTPGGLMGIWLYVNFVNEDSAARKNCTKASLRHIEPAARNPSVPYDTEAPIPKGLQGLSPAPAVILATL